jgi:hypothetical protein
LSLICNETEYLIDKLVVENATGFCWESPQKKDSVYIADGTFAFISNNALKTLLQKGVFVYDGITWRETARTDDTITVRADLDRTEMTISLSHPLPLVLSMNRNPLGIDWNFKKHE